MAAHERRHTDPEQWRALMALPDAMLLQAWRSARQASHLARAQNQGVHDAEMWESLIEGAAASRFGVVRCHTAFRASFPNEPPN